MLINNRWFILFFCATAAWIHLRKRNRNLAVRWKQDYFGPCTRRWQIGNLTVEWLA